MPRIVRGPSRRPDIHKLPDKIVRIYISDLNKYVLSKDKGEKYAGKFMSMFKNPPSVSAIQILNDDGTINEMYVIRKENNTASGKDKGKQNPKYYVDRFIGDEETSFATYDMVINRKSSTFEFDDMTVRERITDKKRAKIEKGIREIQLREVAIKVGNILTYFAMIPCIETVEQGKTIFIMDFGFVVFGQI